MSERTQCDNHILAGYSDGADDEVTGSFLLLNVAAFVRGPDLIQDSSEAGVSGAELFFE
ncbi:hypothetical protein [Arthrobacter sp. NPDC058127]|uniref:hypothetical protein n=1 Tax=Arthrobacter sp. NPDC058127 TaxID=3346351 RepID=UPI0036E39EC4